MGEPRSVLMAEAARRGQDGGRLVRYVTAGSPHGEHDQSAADGDQGCLRPEHGAEDQGSQGGENDTGQFGRGGGAVRLESFRRVRAAGAGQVPDGQPGQDSAHRQDGQWPPCRFGAEAQAMRKTGEDLRLEVVDQREETIGRRGYRHPRTAAMSSSR
jgi:hypothetical protein